MTAHVFPFHGTTLTALPSGALWWAKAGVLAVSDLHFGKAQRPLRWGGAALPPYEVRDTLARLDADIATTDPAHVICLGDSFDDAGASTRLDEGDRLWLARLMAGRLWTWIAGNHDPAPLDLGGTHTATLRLGPLTFRHIADPATTGEVSGHYHPKARLPTGWGAVARPCFLADAARVILPAYGRYTGGLDCTAAPLAALMGPGARAILTGDRARAIPMPRAG